eukprot:7379082-Prymnesium_polylepis.1
MFLALVVLLLTRFVLLLTRFGGALAFPCRWVCGRHRSCSWCSSLGTSGNQRSCSCSRLFIPFPRCLRLARPLQAMKAHKVHVHECLTQPLCGDVAVVDIIDNLRNLLIRNGLQRRIFRE